MKTQQRLNKDFFLFATPLLTCLTVAVSPSQAATFAESQVSATSLNFSYSPYKTLSATDVDSFTQGLTDSGSFVFADAKANADFFAGSNPIATNAVLSQAGGQGSDYFGRASSAAVVSGDFFIDPSKNSTFSFNFFAGFNLLTNIDISLQEQATAKANLTFQVLEGTNCKSSPSKDVNCDFTNVLDFFSISANLNTPGNESNGGILSPFSLSKSSNFTVDPLFLDPNFSGPQATTGFLLHQEEANWSILGSYQRNFNTPTYLRFVQVKQASVTVKAPEPSSTLGLVALAGLVCIGFAAKRKNSTNKFQTETVRISSENKSIL